MLHKPLLATIYALLALVATALVVTAAPDGPKTGPSVPLTTASTAFTYQGRLTSTGSPANGQYDFQFTLYDAPTGGSVVAGPISVLSQTVTDGLFTVSLDFGSSAFQGDARWLEISVQQSGGGGFTTLSPRQALTPAPYALSLVPGATVHAGLSLPLLTLSNTNGTGLNGESTLGNGITGISHNSTSGGVYGYNDAGGDGVTGSGGNGNGVKGVSQSSVASGVYGENFSGGYGVAGRSNSTSTLFAAIYGQNTSSGTGIYGTGGGYGVLATSPNIGLDASGGNDGVIGIASNSGGDGIYGLSTNTTSGTGVYGSASSANGTGVYGFSASGTSLHGESNSGYGIYGHTTTAITATTGAIYGLNSGAGYGVEGQSTNGFGVYATTNATSTTSSALRAIANLGAKGVYGQSSSSEGVYGQSSSGDGVYGVSSSNYGVYGASNTQEGVYGVSSNNNGLHGHTTNPSYAGTVGDNATSGDGVFGQSVTGSGVHGNSLGGGAGVNGTSASGPGVQGTSTSGNGMYAFASAGGVSGIFAENEAAGGYGIYAKNRNGYAGYFEGDLHATGTCCGMSEGTIQIDDPTDPANKYLNQYAVASPELKDIYDGIVTTDAAGNATVHMPPYFQALDGNYRYQLTVIGQFAQAIVATEIQGTHFTIKTDKPNVKVSWQVTGIRQDPYARVHTLPAEQDKPADEQGYYLHPELYGQPASRAISKASGSAPGATQPSGK